MRIGLPLIFVAATLAAAAPAMGETAPVGTKPQAPQKRVVVPKGPACYDVRVTLLPTHPKGGNWDPWPGNRANPDPVVRELTTGTKAVCVDTFVCDFRLTASGRLEFLIEDDDPDASDPVGHAACTAGKACQVGRSKITFAQC